MYVLFILILIKIFCHYNKNMDYLLAFIIAIAIGICIAIVIFLSLIISDTSNTPTIPLITLTCNGSQTPQHIDLPSSFPFNLETTTLGSGAFTLLYYSDVERTNLIATTYGITSNDIQQIDIGDSSDIKAMSYIFLCDKVEIEISTDTLAPVPIDPFIPYVFRNTSLSDTLMVSVSGVSGSQMLPAITAGSTGFPDPPTGWDSYTAMLTP
jgi:hypothetical protein